MLAPISAVHGTAATATSIEPRYRGSADLIERSVELLLRNRSSLRPRLLTLPPGYAHAERAEKNGTLRLRNTFYALPERGELRAVSISSPKIDIVTLFFYPEPDRQLPVFAMEFVELGPRPIVGVIDLCSLLAGINSTTAHLLRTTRSAFPQLVQADDPPEWFQQCRSGDDFFIRPRDQQDLDELATAHLQVWQTLLTLAAQPRRLESAEALAHQQKIQDYKHHHRDHSPGLRLLNRSFGSEWTESYMRDHLFA